MSEHTQPVPAGDARPGGTHDTHGHDATADASVAAPPDALPGGAATDETAAVPTAGITEPPGEPAPKPAGLRVADADREAVAEALREAGLEGRLSPDELAQREHLAYAAVTAPQLYDLVADLPSARDLVAGQLAPYGLGHPRREPAATAETAETAGDGAARWSSQGTVSPNGTMSIWGVLGDVKRQGSFTLPQRVTMNLALGEMRVDLREAQPTHDVTTVDVLGTLGEVKVIVPDTWRIESNGTGVLGTFQVKDVDEAGAPAPDGPIVRFNGAMFLGEVTVLRTNREPGLGGFTVDGLKGVRNRRHHREIRGRR